MERVAAIKSLINWDAPVPQLADLIRRFPWDSEDELGQLTADHVVNAINRFLRREVSADEVEAWANLIEGRDDVGYASNGVKQALVRLANPSLFEPFTMDSARRLLAEIAAG